MVPSSAQFHGTKYNLVDYYYGKLQKVSSQSTLQTVPIHKQLCIIRLGQNAFCSESLVLVIFFLILAILQM